MKCLKVDSAPGVTGLSYNMMRTWTEPIIDAAYRGIASYWTSDTFPPDWTWKWLAPIPKKPQPHLDDLRPLSLLEPLRKVWMSIVVRKIWTSWLRSGVVNPSQHGSVPGRGTATAIVELINALETAKETRSTLLLTSWDIKRAFDSVSQPLIQWSLQRLGVPPPLAAIIVALDASGGSVVRTPFAIAEHRKGTPLADLSFSPERGIAQGDVSSSLIWVAVFDIILDALHLAEPGTFLTKDRNGNVKTTRDIAYADDLLSLQAHLRGLQAKADMMSAVCIILGFTLAIAKFRAMKYIWGNEYCSSPTTHTTNGPLTHRHLQTPWRVMGPFPLQP